MDEHSIVHAIGRGYSTCMLHNRLRRIAPVAFASALSVCVGWAQAQHRPEAFPLAKGSYWIYEGTKKWQEQGPKVFTEKITQRMQVLNRVERGGIVAAVVRGYPNSEEETVQILIVVDGLEFYLLDSEDAILKRLKDPNDALVELVQEDHLILSLPLVRGKRFCEASEMTRPDGFYCWRVEEQRKEKLNGVKGMSNEAERTIYTIAFRTLPDHVFVNFVPGIGITSYEYAHHGTVEETDLKLVEFHPAAAAPH